MNPESRLLRFSNWLLSKIYDEELYDEIHGDMLELYNERLTSRGRMKASLLYLWDAVLSVRNIGLRKKKEFSANRIDMLRGNFKAGYRHLMKSKTYSLINVFGLVVGITAFFLIAQYISFELSYDQFHANNDEIYRVAIERNVNGEVTGSTECFDGMKGLISEHIPEIENSTFFYKTPANTGFLFRYNNKIYNEPGGIINADSTFFSVFPSLLMRGDSRTVIRDKKNIVLSESMAKRIFGDVDPIGKNLERMDDHSDGNSNYYVVTGILKDIPTNAHFHASFILNIDEEHPESDLWKDNWVNMYVTISTQRDLTKITLRVNKLLEQIGKKYPNVKGTTAFFQPITNIHLSSHYDNELESPGSKLLLGSIGLVGIVILLMAWINYVNLESARFIFRSKEVGIRRIIGSKKSDLAIQFLVEYFCLNLCALVIAFLLLIFILPWFSALSGIAMQNMEWKSTEVWVIGFLIFVFGSLITGAYPGFFLVRLNPLSSLKGNGYRGQRNFVRQSLVTVQFTASIILIAFVLVVNQQLDLMKVSNKMIEVDQVIALRNPTAYANERPKVKHGTYKVFENTLVQNASIEMMTSSSAIPGTEIGFSYINLIKRKANAPYDPTIFKTQFVGTNYIPTYGIKLLAGRNFEEPGQSWTPPWEDKNWNTIILNEKAIRHLGFRTPEEAIDQEVSFDAFDDGPQKFIIIGVMEDFHHEAIKKQVYPTIFVHNYDSFQQVYYSIRLEKGTNPRDALIYIQKSWQEIFPEKPFEYFFLDDYYDQQFKSELHFENLFSLFAGVAIFIACLGILGMTLFEANIRLKEISIRKVLGASSASLVALLSRDHIRVVFVSFLIAGPLIYYVAEKWLATYPIRIEISAIYFVIPFMIILIMVLVTSSFQTVKAANTNPVDHLKYE